MRLFILLLAFECFIPACGQDDSKGTTDAVSQGNTGLEAPGSGATGERGPQGPQGTVGAKGDKGDKGDAGNAGTQGVAGTAGKDGEAVPLNQWYDPITKKDWLITPSQVWSQDGCGIDGTWSYPTPAQMQVGINHGIFFAAHDLGGDEDSAWTGEAGNSGGHIAILPGFTGAVVDSQQHGIFCTK